MSCGESRHDTINQSLTLCQCVLTTPSNDLLIKGAEVFVKETQEKRARVQACSCVCVEVVLLPSPSHQPHDLVSWLALTSVLSYVSSLAPAPQGVFRMPTRINLDTTVNGQYNLSLSSGGNFLCLWLHCRTSELWTTEHNHALTGVQICSDLNASFKK